MVFVAFENFGVDGDPGDAVDDEEADRGVLVRFRGETGREGQEEEQQQDCNILREHRGLGHYRPLARDGQLFPVVGRVSIGHFLGRFSAGNIFHRKRRQVGDSREEFRLAANFVWVVIRSNVLK